MNQRRIMLICNHPDSAWVKAAKEALSLLGPVIQVPEQQALAGLRQQAYDLVMIDASGVTGNVVAMVRQLHCLRPQTAIVVVTTSPTWRRARDLFLAGAADYARRTLEKEKILRESQELLARLQL